jgi:hypothetical protein
MFKGLYDPFFIPQEKVYYHLNIMLNVNKNIIKLFSKFICKYWKDD